VEFVLCTASKDDKTKDDGIDGVPVTYKDMRNTSKVLVEAYKGKKLLGKHRGRRGIILKFIFKKQRFERET
jgi:Zn/Cd-binding protein ZinT